MQQATPCKLFGPFAPSAVFIIAFVLRCVIIYSAKIIPQLQMPFLTMRKRVNIRYSFDVTHLVNVWVRCSLHATIIYETLWTHLNTANVRSIEPCPQTLSIISVTREITRSPHLTYE